MASHGVTWVPGMHVHFGNLDFIVTTEGEVAQVTAAVQPLHSVGLNMIVEALEELQLHASEAHVLGSDRLLSFDYRRLERQLNAFLGPRPSREEPRCLTFSFANAMMQLAGGEPLSLEHLTLGARQCSRSVCAMLRGPFTTSWRSACTHPL